MKGTTGQTFTVEGNQLQTIDPRRAYETAIKLFKETKRPVTIFLNGEKYKTIDAVYTVEGCDCETAKCMHAITVAKDEAIKSKYPRRVFKNGNPLYLIDRKGILVAA